MKNYYHLLCDEEEDNKESETKLACVGAGLGGGVDNIQLNCMQ